MQIAIQELPFSRHEFAEEFSFDDLLTCHNVLFSDKIFPESCMYQHFGGNINNPPELTQYFGIRNRRLLFAIGSFCNIRPDARLAAGGAMCEELTKFFDIIKYHVNTWDKKRKFKQSDVADALDELGCASANGRKVHATHVCNVLKAIKPKDRLTYKKPTYLFHNHMSFNSKSLPKKEIFAQM